MSQDSGQLAPGLADTARAVSALVGSSKAASAARQAEAERFIKENGKAAMTHTPVTTEVRGSKGP